MSWWFVILIGFVWSTLISHFGASILLHRYYCHRQFHVPVWFEVVGLFMLMIAVIRSPIGWIASHRLHHQYENTDDDPHSPNHIGIWKVLTTTWTIDRIPIRFSKDLYKNPRLVFCHKHWKKIMIAVWIISLLIGFKFFVAFALMPFLHAKIGFGLLNTVTHIGNEVRNVGWLDFLIAGEGYHKNHHLNHKRIILSNHDTGGMIVKLLIKYGVFDELQNRKNS